MKKIISIILAFTLALGIVYMPGNTVVSSVSAEEIGAVDTVVAAPTPTPYGDTPAPKAASAEMPSDFTYGLSASKLNTFLSLINSAIKSNTATINVYSYKIPYNSYTVNLFFDEIFCNPEYFNILTYSYSYSEDGYLNQIYFYYSLDNATYLSQLANCEMVAEQMLEGIKDSNLSDYARLLLLHDRIATWTEYDYEGLEVYKSWTDPPYTIYGVFVKQLAVCQGYSMAYKYLLNKLGIKNYICSSADLFHAWNIVYVNGKPYHVDITWDDPSYLNQSTGKYVRAEGMVRHDNFLISTNELINTGHTADDFSSLPTDTYFDDFWWEDSFSEFVLLNGNIYYILNKNAAGNAKIYKCDTTLNNNTYLTSVKDVWYDSYYGSGWAYYDSFARLSTDGTSLYVSGDKEIYKYNASSNTLKATIWPTTGSGNILGFKIDHNLIKYTTVYGPTYTCRQQQFTSLPAEEGLIFRDGKWVYVKDGVVNTNTTTLVCKDKTWYYVKNGVVDFSATTLVKYYGTWYYVNKGKVDFSATTLFNYYGTWYYVNKGIVDFKATTLVKYGNSWYYVQKGVLKWGVETLVNYFGTYYYVKNSTVDFGATTLCNYYGTWYYVNKGVVDFKATTLVKYGNSWFYVQKGVLKWGVETLVNYYGTYYYVKNSTVDFGATTLVKYGNDWYYVQKGVLKWGANTLVNYNGTWYYVKNSTVDFSATTLVKYGGTWFYVNKGVLRWGVTTLVNYYGTWYYVRNSQVNFNEVVLIQYGNDIYFVRNGKVEFSYTGYVLCEGRYYYVRNGVVV